MKEIYFTLDILRNALAQISKASKTDDSELPIIICTNDDNPSVIRLAALVETEDDNDEFIVLTDNVDELDELNSGGTKVITAACVRDINDIEE